MSIRDRRHDESCALCGSGPHHACINIFTGAWMRLQPVRDDVPPEHQPHSVGAVKAGSR